MIEFNMEQRKLSGLALAAVFLLTLAAQAPLLARESGDKVTYQRYVVELQDLPLALYDGRALSVPNKNGEQRMDAAIPAFTGEKKLDVNSARSQQYLGFLAQRHRDFESEMQSLLGRQPEVRHRYRTATNGVAVDLTPAEAGLLAASPLVRSVEAAPTYRLDTYAGPEWLGAGDIWNGDAGVSPRRGEGVVIANIDTGINWEHPSFADNTDPGYTYVNPYGAGLGLCSDPEVMCNNKLVGVYDFVQDDPDTEDWVEENTKGKDNDGHGSHTAGTAAGAPVNVFLNGAIDEVISGVAPRAHIISYRVCYKGEPSSSESEGCGGSEILAAIDQAVTDGVDVINYSIGGDARDPWANGSADRAFLGARGAGIFVASSAGNTGPNPGTVTSPALAPWIMAVGNASHNALLGNLLEDFSGGSQPPPDPMVGTSQTDGIGPLTIVHAKDYGFPLCGTGPEAEDVPSCFSGSSQTNPWAGSQPFNGEIVVCDRGTYGRIEKGLNLKLAGAGGYVLANTGEWSGDLRSDDHCLPATHIDTGDGDTLRAWLDSGSNHQASISGLKMAELDLVADTLSSSSSRGPAVAPVQDTLKPNVIAPGTSILAAGFSGEGSFLSLSGTSMASPHIAGAAALLKSVHESWGPSRLFSAIEMTATQELAKDENGEPATTEQVGAGRPRLGEAANAGLYLPVTTNDFYAANPVLNGDPGALNLPGLVNSSCKASCSFHRRVRDMMGGGSWTATPEGFPEGTVVTVTPSSFTLSSLQTRDLDIDIDVSGSGVVGDWVSGKIRLSAAGSSDLYLTASVYSHGGDLPQEWVISDDRDGGWQNVGLDNLVALPDATFRAGGFTQPQQRAETREEDPTRDDPYDDDSGVFTQWYSLPQGALWLYAETLASTATDIDLFVGRDDNGNGFADEWEELCASHTPEDLERCDLFDLEPGDYWIVVQNWDGVVAGGDQMTLLHAAIEAGSGSLAASGPGIAQADENLSLRLSWDDVNALPGETWLGAVGIGSNRDSPNNLGIVPVRFQRTGFAAPATFPLMEGRTHGLALSGNGRHDRAFIDVPPGTAQLTVSASGGDAAQSNALTLELVRLDFAEAMDAPPFATPAGNAAVVASASGSGGVGPSVTLSGGVQAGRWYAVLSNGSASPAAVELTAGTVFEGTPVPINPGLWSPKSRGGTRQGYDYNWGGNSRSLLWYTYDEAGQPTWYIAGDAVPDGNIWVADILRVTNDGAQQQLSVVGSLSVTMLNLNEAMYSYRLFGLSGTELSKPVAAQTCPLVDGTPTSYTGMWYRGSSGIGGATLLVNDFTQAQVHYVFDTRGMPRWLFVQDPVEVDPYDPEIEFLQFHGYCAVCAPAGVDFDVVGTLGRTFTSESTGEWTLDYEFLPPLSGSASRTESIVKLSERAVCQ